MKTDRLSKTLAIAFVSALALYVVMFNFIQGKRTGKGPWNAVFLTDDAGEPALLIEQKNLGISERIEFPDQTLPETNLNSRFVFDDPTRTNVPFGNVIFQDLTFLPGTVTLNLFGHEIEFLPRVLIIDKKEHNWKSGKVIAVMNDGEAGQPEAKSLPDN